MSQINKYAVIMPHVKHIQHTFDSYAQAEQWMHSTNSGGYIAIIVGEVVAKTKTTKQSQEIIKFAKQFDQKENTK